MRHYTIVIVTLAAGVLAGGARADVIHVPGDQPDIQSAVLASSSGDEIVIAPGTYTGPGNRGVRFHGRRLTVRSATRDPADVIVRCEGLDRAFTLRDEPESGSVIQGLHIVDGRETAGGAIYVNGADVAILDCRFTNNTATSGGGAIDLYDTSSVVRRCRFRANSAQYGGGVSCVTGYTTRPVIEQCEFLGNRASWYGGAFFAANTLPVVTNCVFSGNEADLWGGAIVLDAGGDVVMTNCVISRNSTAGTGGGLSLLNDAAPLLTNCILWENVDEHGTGERSQIDWTEGTPVVNYSCVQGTWSGPGFGNIDADPRFVDADGPDDRPGTLDDDCRLRADSPCIDAGYSVAIEVDLDGHRRIVDDPATPDTGAGYPAVIDLGAHEFGSHPPCPADLDGNGVVDFADVLVVLGGWGECP